VGNAQTLVDAGADLLAKDGLGEQNSILYCTFQILIPGFTPLDLADKADHSECMSVLRGAVDKQEQEKQMDFYHLLDACAAGDLNTVRSILGSESQVGELVNYVPNGSSSLLFKASEHGQKDVVKYLIEKGARAVIHPVTKYSPLYIAAYNGKKEIVEVLLKKFPELINVQTVEKWLPLHAACFNGHAAVLEFLLKYKFPEDVLVQFKDRTGGWKYNLPFDINQRDLSGQSILYMACCIGNLRMVDLLLEYKVKATSTTLPAPTEEEIESENSTPKHKSIGLSALISKFQTKEEVLRSNEAWVKPVDLDLYCNHDSETALHVAVRNKHHAITSHLLAAGALPNLNIQNNNQDEKDKDSWSKGHTCIVEAAKNRDMGMIDLLLKYGARDDQNQALSVASQAKDNLVMSKLLALKAHQDQESVVNKNAIAEMHLGKSLKGRSSASSLTYNYMCPSTPVMINWHQTGSLTTIKEQWLIDSAVRINPKLRLSPKYQPMALHAVTRLDLSNNEIVVVPSTVFNMQSLKFLSLAGNKLEALPDCAYNCLWLEEIQLQDNRLD
jgi:ankyrin repeat protein